jgi:putative ABC transport system permease protein
VQDVRYGLRRVLQSPGFSAVVVATLALGIGANAALFSVVDAVLLRALPYAAPERLVTVEHYYPSLNHLKASVSAPGFRDYATLTEIFSGVAVEDSWGANLTGEGEPERLRGALVSGRFFGTLGVPPAAGRPVVPGDDVAGRERVVVLSHGLAERLLGGPRRAVGRSLLLNGRSYQVVGVMPPSFRDVSKQGVELWAPLVFSPEDLAESNRPNEHLALVARLRPGISPERAQAELTGFAGRLKRAYPQIYPADWNLALTTLHEKAVGDLRVRLLVLLGAVGAVLLIACANVASLLLARASGRAREVAVRTALGATRWQLVRQLLVESLLLALSGAALGTLVAEWALRALIAGSGVEFPSFIHVAVTPRALLATACLAVLCGVVFGLAPLATGLGAAVAPRLGRDEASAARGRGWRRFQRAVVVGQVALALVLAVDAALLARSFQRMIGEDLGFQAGDLLTFRIDPRGPRYAQDDAVVKRLRQEYLPRIAAVPGVDRVALSDPTMPTDGWVGGFMTVEDHDSSLPDGMVLAMWHAVTPAFFDLLRIPVVAGRGFTAEDTESNAVVVSKSLAQAEWPGQRPLGKRLKLGPRGAKDAPWLTVVGVVADVRHEGIQRERAPAPDLYISLLQFLRRPPLTINFLVRPKRGVPPDRLRAALHQEMMRIEPELPDYDVATLAERLTRQTDTPRFELLLISLFTLLAVGLAAVGIYGVTAHGIEQRRREIAIRMSLGADRARVLRMVVGRGAAMAALGLGLGLPILVALGRLLVDLLYDTSPTDPLILGGTALALFLVTLAASYLPARRAATVDPVEGLRLQ